MLKSVKFRRGEMLYTLLSVVFTLNPDDFRVELEVLHRLLTYQALVADAALSVCQCGSSIKCVGS